MIDLHGVSKTVVSGTEPLTILHSLDLHIDQMIFPERVGDNHLAPNTALNFFLVGFSLLIIDASSRLLRARSNSSLPMPMMRNVDPPEVSLTW